MRVLVLKNSDGSKWWAAIIIVAALTAVEYGPVIVSGKIPFPASIVYAFPSYAGQYPQGPHDTVANIGDLVTSFYPYHAMAARAVRQGSLPLWDANILSGAPLAGNTQSALFYPPNYLYDVLSVKTAWALALMMERLLAALFMLLLVRELGGSPVGALVSAVLFAFSGFLIAWQGQAMADSAVWLPLICYAVLRLHRRPSFGSIALAATAFAMPVLAGHPETAAHLTMTGTFAAIVLTFTKSSGRTPNLKFARSFIAAGLLAIGLASIQLLPTLEWIHLSHRSLNDVWPPLPISSILAFVSRDIMRSTNTAGLDIPEQAAYMGMLVFLGIPLAMFHSSRKLTIVVAAGCLALFSIIYGVGPLLSLLNSIPYMGLRQWRLLLVLTLGMAILAGLGISALEQQIFEKRNIRWRAALLVACGLGVGFALVYLLHRRTHEIAEVLRIPRASLIFLLGSAVVVFARIAGWINRMQFNILIVSVLAADVVTFSYRYLPNVRADEVFPAIELFDRLKQQSGDPFRVAQLDGDYPANAEAVYDLESAQGYEIPLERFATFMSGAGRNDGDSVMVDSAPLVTGADRRVDMLNVRYFLVQAADPVAELLHRQPNRFRFAFSANNTDVFENLHVMPRAFVVPVSGIEVIADERRQLSRVQEPSFDPEHSVILANAGDAAPGPVSGQTQLNWISKSADSFQLKVRVPQPSVLVVSQIYYPGWKATIDGAIVGVLPANYALSAISLPAGAHDVRFYYDPASFKIGAILSALSLMIVAFTAVRWTWATIFPWRFGQ